MKIGSRRRSGISNTPPEAYLEWADTSQVPLGTMAKELGVSFIK